VDLKNVHDLHLVISVFMDFLRRMPGRIISKELFNSFPLVSGKLLKYLDIETNLK